MKYTSSAVKESGVASFEYLETDGYVKGSALASLVEFPREGIHPKPCSSPERIFKCLRRHALEILFFSRDLVISNGIACSLRCSWEFHALA